MGWTLLSALCLLHLLAQIIGVTESVYNQNQHHSGPESCNADEYKDADHCCKMCPAGEYVKEPCVRPHTQGKCVTCDRGTYTAYANGLDTCLLCYTCHADQEMVLECSPTRNRRCQCKAGHFYQDSGSSESCLLCDKCPEGIPVLQECNATSNRVCRAADPKSTTWLYLILPIAVLGVCPLIKCRTWRRCHLFNSTGRSGGSSLIGASGSPAAGNVNGYENMVGRSESESCIIECGDEFGNAETSTSHTSSDEEESCTLSHSFQSSSPCDQLRYVVKSDIMAGAVAEPVPEAEEKMRRLSPRTPF